MCGAHSIRIHFVCSASNSMRRQQQQQPPPRQHQLAAHAHAPQLTSAEAISDADPELQPLRGSVEAAAAAAGGPWAVGRLRPHSHLLLPALLLLLVGALGGAILAGGGGGSPFVVSREAESNGSGAPSALRSDVYALDIAALAAVPGVELDPRLSASEYSDAPYRACVVLLAPDWKGTMSYDFFNPNNTKVLYRRYVLVNLLRSVDRHFHGRKQQQRRTAAAAAAAEEEEEGGVFKHKYPILLFHTGWTAEQRAWLRARTSSALVFVSIEILATPSFTSPEQVDRWQRTGEDGAVRGRPLGYRQMCRFWTGVLQNHPALQPFDYYLRFDDDSVLTGPWEDPFRRLSQEGLLYAFTSNASDSWGIARMWELQQAFVVDPAAALQRALGGEEGSACEAHLVDWQVGIGGVSPAAVAADALRFGVSLESTRERMQRKGYLTADGRYNGGQPYNNFHVADLSMWRTPLIRAWFHWLDCHLGFYKYRFGDANTHALLIGSLLPSHASRRWPGLPYRHNWHVDGKNLKGPPTWIDEAIRNDTEAFM